MKFKNDIELQAGLEDLSGSTGTSGQLLSSTATGTAWIDPSTIPSAAATLVVIACKNTSGAAIAQGTPVYQTGTVGVTATIEIAPADALISANKLQAIGLLQTALSNNGFGNVVITGELTNFTTDPIDGLTPTTGDKIFVKSGGGLTLTKPTGEGNGIQNMGLVGKVSSGNSGSITVSSIMRTNDVPNLPEGRIWIGDGNTIVSDTVYVDEPNNRVGIGTTSPNEKLEVSAATDTTISIASSDTSLNAGQNIGILEFASNNETSLSQAYTAFSKIKGISETAVSGTASVNGAITFETASANVISERMRIDSTGNVGIGTSTPNADFVVSHQGTSGIEIEANFQMGVNNILSFDRTVGALAYETMRLSANDYWFTTLGIERMRITSTGKVGIGTTNPQDALDVDWDTEGVATDNSGIRVRAYRPHLNLIDRSGYTTSNGHNFQIKADSAKLQFNATSADNETFDLTRMVIDKDGNVGIGTTAPNGRLNIQSGASSTYLLNLDYADGTDGGGFYEASSTDLSLYLKNSSGTNTVTIATDGDSFLNGGNVGIGTTSPDTNLEVESSTGGVLRLTSSDTTVLTGESIGKIEFKSNDASTGGDNVMGFIDSVATNAGTRYALSFGTGDAAAAVERMRIDNLGAVRFNNYGAGTLVSDASGNITVSSGGGAGGPYLPLSAGSSEILTGDLAMNNNIGIITKDSSGAFRDILKLNSTNVLEIGSSSLNTDTIFKNTGNVGIGITSPLNPLSIENSSSPLIKIRNTTNGGGAAIEFNDNGASTTNQNGKITYYHSDTTSQGGGSSYWLTGEDDQTLVLANNGRVVVQRTGSSTEVGYGFYDDINTGMYRISADNLGFATGGTRRLDMNSSGVRIGTGSRVSTILDQDNMSSNSNTALATQQSIKAYVDNSVAAIITPAAPSTVTSTIVGETIEIAFNQSTTSDIDYYQVWSSDDGGDYGIIGQITSDDFSATMTVVDTTFVTGGTMSYRVYAVRQGVYSSAATTSKSYTVSALSVTNMTVVNLNTAYYIQYEKPNSRFIDHIEIWMDSQTTQAALNRTNATLVYSGQNHSYMRNVNTSNNFHQFWVEIVTS